MAYTNIRMDMAHAQKRVFLVSCMQCSEAGTELGVTMHAQLCIYGLAVDIGWQSIKYVPDRGCIAQEFCIEQEFSI